MCNVGLFASLSYEHCYSIQVYFGSCTDVPFLPLFQLHFGRASVILVSLCERNVDYAIVVALLVILEGFIR